jgi:hypothetical protein
LVVGNQNPIGSEYFSKRWRNDLTGHAAFEGAMGCRKAKNSRRKAKNSRRKAKNSRRKAKPHIGKQKLMSESKSPRRKAEADI